MFARPLDLTESQAEVLNVGTGAGALIGAAIPVIAGSHDSFAVLSAGAIGAVLGASIMTASFPSPDAVHGLGRLRTSDCRQRPPRDSRNFMDG